MLPDVRHAGAGLDRAGRSCQRGTRRPFVARLLPCDPQAVTWPALRLAPRPLGPDSCVGRPRLPKSERGRGDECPPGAHLAGIAGRRTGFDRAVWSADRPAWSADRPADRLRTPFEVSLADDPKAVDMDSEAPTLAKALAVAGKLISRIAGPHLPAAARPPGPWRSTISRGSRPADAAPPDTHPGRRTQAAWTGGRTARGSRGSRATRAARRRTGPRPGCR